MIWIPLVTLAMLVFMGGVAAAPLSSLPTVTITPTAAHLPPDVAALSGIWEGAWDSVLPTRLVVEELERDAAVVLVVYAWGDHPSGHPQGGSIRRRVPVFLSGTLQWKSQLSPSQESVTSTFILTKDHRHLYGERYFQNTGRVSIAIMRKMDATPHLSDSPRLVPGTPHAPAEASPLGRSASSDPAVAPPPPEPPFTSEASGRFRAGYYREAIPLAEDVLRSREVTLGPAHQDVAISLSSLAELHHAQGRYAEAEPLHQRALAIRESALGPMNPAVAASLSGLARLSRAQGRYAEAEPLYLQALAIRQQTFGPTHPAVATSLNELAELYRSQGRYAQAELLYQRTLAIREQTLGPAHLGVASSLNNLALLYREQGRYAEAELLHQRTLAIREQTLGPTHPAVATSLHHLADLYTAQARYVEAEPLFQRALAIRGQTFGSMHPDLATSLDELAWLYAVQGRYTEAEPLYQRALTIKERMLGPMHFGVASTLDNMGELYSWQRRYAEAEPLYQRALAIRKQALGPTHLGVARSLDHLARTYAEQGRYVEAEPLHQRALVIREQMLGPMHPSVASSLDNLGNLYIWQGRYAEAKPLYQRALAIQEQTLGPAHPMVAATLGNLATLLTQQDQRALARPLFEQARQIYLAMSHANVDLAEEAYRGVLRQHTRSLRAYIALLATLADEPGFDSSPPATALAAFVVAEQARGGAVQLALARVGARAAVTEASTAALARQVQELQQRQRAIWQQLSAAYGTPMAGWGAGRMASLQQSIQQVDRELAEATDRLRQAFPRYTELAAPVPIEVPAVEALLHRDEALVSFFTLPDRVLVWLVRPGEAPVYRDVPIAKATLTAMVARVRRSLEQGPWQPFDVAQAHALYALLLAPLRAQLTGVRHLLLVPDDVLRPLPFGVLVTEAMGQPYQRLADLVAQQRRPTAADLTTYARLAWLAKDYALTMLPSATTLRTLRQIPRLPKRAGEPLLAFGDPVLQGNGGRRGGGPMLAARGAQVPLEVLRQLPRLPETRAELLAVATALGADPRQALYLGEQATKPMVQALHRSGRLAQAQVLAFATHALLAGELTGLRQPALVLTPPLTASDEDDGLLTLEDILGLTLPQASWVILSACNTAADDGSGEALSGLARAFFYAGAASLLVSQWSVDDVATRVLMTEVFRRHAGDPTLSRAEALRQGMLAVMTRAQGKTAYFAHPYAWAPFVLVGEGGRSRP